MNLLLLFAIVLLLSLLPFLILYTVLILHVRARRYSLSEPVHPARPPSPTIAFLHPHALSGGGGERVLWCALLATHSRFPHAKLVVYSAWCAASIPLAHAVDVARRHVRAQFGLDLSDLSFLPVDLPNAALVDPAHYPQLTLLRQAFGAVRLGGEAYVAQPADVVVDTANLTFSLVVPKLLGARTVSYVHYPTISTDMLRVVRERRAQFNNTARIAASPRLSFAKLLYYRLFALAYALAALCCDVAMANSSWTAGHLRALWWGGERVVVVFPPCATVVAAEETAVVADADTREQELIVSVGQFRPEKEHARQLDVMEALRRRDRGGRGGRLVMVGGTRNKMDAERAAGLATEAARRGLNVSIRVNASRGELGELLRKASVGLHTMRDEHFGISVVELQAAGLLVVAHRSGGVAADIVEEGVSGVLVSGEVEEYAEAVEMVLGGKKEAMRAAAVRSASRFSDAAFGKRFVEVVGRAV